MIKKVYAIVYDCPGLLQFGEVLVYNVNIYKQEHLFGNAIDFAAQQQYYIAKEFRTSVLAGNGGLHMSNEQILKMITDELEKVTDNKFLVTVYLFIQKFNSKAGS